MKIFGRDPALLLALFAAVVQLASIGLHLGEAQQGALNAVAIGVVGLATAVAVERDKLAAALLGLLGAAIALALAFGLQLSSDVQAGVMAVATAVIAAFIRTQVTAKVSANELM